MSLCDITWFVFSPSFLAWLQQLDSEGLFVREGVPLEVQVGIIQEERIQTLFLPSASSIALESQVMPLRNHCSATVQRRYFCSFV